MARSKEEIEQIKKQAIKKQKSLIAISPTAFVVTLIGIAASTILFWMFILLFIAPCLTVFFGPSIEEQLKMPEGYRPNSK